MKVKPEEDRCGRDISHRDHRVHRVRKQMAFGLALLPVTCHSSLDRRKRLQKIHGLPREKIKRKMMMGTDRVPRVSPVPLIRSTSFILSFLRYSGLPNSHVGPAFSRTS
jgi:hypothetical protein